MNNDKKVGLNNKKLMATLDALEIAERQHPNYTAAKTATTVAALIIAAHPDPAEFVMALASVEVVVALLTNCVEEVAEVPGFKDAN